MQEMRREDPELSWVLHLIYYQGRKRKMEEEDEGEGG